MVGMCYETAEFLVDRTRKQCKSVRHLSFLHPDPDYTKLTEEA